MTKIYEDHIEQFAVELLEQLGYRYLYGPTIAYDGEQPMRSNYQDVVLHDPLQAAIARLNPSIPYDLQLDAIKQLMRADTQELLTNNENFHKLLTEGVPVTFHKDNSERGDYVQLLDFANPENNEFFVCNQFTVIENNRSKRPDVILFVNGLPLVVIEIKNATDANATIKGAYEQINTYKDTIPSLFTFNAFNIITDGLEAQAGSLSAGFSRFMSWKSADGKGEASHLISELETLIKGMLNKDTLLDLIRYFTVFEKDKKEDPKTGITTISNIKKIAAYHQYYAVNKAVQSTLRAAGYLNISSDLKSVNEAPEQYGLPSVKHKPEGDRKAGVVWHTQGSGKSLSMVFYTGKIVVSLSNPTILVITDRNDLDDQLFDTFAASKQLLRQTPIQADSREHLKELLKVASGGVVFATIQKFQPEEGANEYELLSNRDNIVVIADEAHRTQYGFKGKVDKTTGELKYGFAKYMRDALPNATYLGFTGTPIEGTDVNTPAVFGDYVDIYDIAQAVEDGATVRIYYESRLAKIALDDEGKRLVEELDAELEEEDLSSTRQAKAKWTKLEALIGSANRVENIAWDIVAHFEERQKVFEGKGMIVAMSRRIAAELYDTIVKIRPEWHNDDLDKGAIKVVMTAASSDGLKLSKHHTTKQQRRALAERMKDTNDELKLVIVRDMWLTGFDAPSMHTLYIDKPMQGHNLMQAIARVNRVYKDKPGGLVVDYLGIASDLKKALAFYSESGGKGDPAETQEKAIQVMLEKLEVVQQLFFGFDYAAYFTAHISQKLSIILGAEEHILGLENGKKRYIDEVTKLSSAFALAVPSDEAMDIKDEVAFFQAVKARLQKFEAGRPSGRTDEELETAIRQVVDKALVSEQVIDVFDAAGIKKPDVSIFSDEFLAEIKGMKHRNVALEVLKKLLNDEIKTRSQTNLIQSRSLMEMLENSIRKYHNKIITAAEFIDELIGISNVIKQSDKEPQELGLTAYEYAFYTAVADNDSARELMQKDKLRELAIVLFERVKQNASIDWNIKESVRAKLKVVVKRTLRQFGYPPDMELLATETVLKQAEMLANQLS